MLGDFGPFGSGIRGYANLRFFQEAQKGSSRGKGGGSGNAGCGCLVIIVVIIIIYCIVKAVMD